MVINQNNSINSVILDVFKDTGSNDLNYIYRGLFTQNITESILDLAERNIDEINQPSQLRRRVYFLMVESLQNITRYQALKLDLLEKSGVFLIQKKGSRYYISTGNLIENEKIKYIKAKLEIVNKLSRDELKDYYRQILRNGKFTEEGGAGLGLIEMVRKSGNRLTFDFKKINDEYSYFYLHTAMPAIDASSDVVKNDLKISLDRVVEIHNELNKENISFIFNSGFSQESLLSLLNVIENQLVEIGGVRKKVFNIMVEMLQNIIHHGSKVDESLEDKPGIFYLKEGVDNYVLNAGNYISNSNVDLLKVKIEAVNNMNRNELEDFYNRKLVDFDGDASNKAGLGIIDMRIKSNRKLKFFFTKISEKLSFFNLEVGIATKLVRN